MGILVLRKVNTGRQLPLTQTGQPRSDLDWPSLDLSTTKDVSQLDGRQKALLCFIDFGS